MNRISKQQWEERQLSSPKRNGDVRTEWDRDYSRLIHSSAFRRLQSKTQVLGLGESDFYRTRLTHSMEVAQIGGGLLQVLTNQLQDKTVYPEISLEIKDLPEYSLLQTICLAHDIGHPPFGHGGEVALNKCMLERGGFEGNGQTLRILSSLDKHSEKYGLNPTRRMLLGILKYPEKYSELVCKKQYEDGQVDGASNWLFKSEPYKPPKCYLNSEEIVVDWILEPFSNADRTLFKECDDSANAHKKLKYKSLDCWIMDIADEISYSVHDLEDAISLGMITESIWNKHFEEIERNPFHSNSISDIINFDDLTKDLFGESHNRKNAIGTLVNFMINSVVFAVQNFQFVEPILKYKVVLNDDVKELRKAIFSLVYKKVILDKNVQMLEFKGQKVVTELFEVFSSDPERFLPESTKKKYLSVSDDEKSRVICDFIAGMTDDYATKMYEKLFHPKKGSIFDRL